MGIFDKFKKSVSKIGKNPFDAKNYLDLGLQTVTAGQVDTDGINGMGSWEDSLFGKKEGGVKADPIAKMIKATQAKGLSELNSALNTSGADIVKTQAESTKKGVLTAAQDARRNAQERMARTGLKNTSLSTALNRSLDTATTKDINTINAGIPGAIREQQIQDANTRINAGGLANAGNIIHRSTPGQRSGGILGIASALAPLAGTAIGAMAGGPAGAAVGSQVGSGVSTAYNRTQPSQYGNYA